MNVERIDGSRTHKADLTLDEVLAETKTALDDPDVLRIEILPNRHERRRRAARARKTKNGSKGGGK